MAVRRCSSSLPKWVSCSMFPASPLTRSSGGCPPQAAPKGPALWNPAPTRRAAGLCPAPTGAFAPDPEMLTHLCFACGRDGDPRAGTFRAGSPKWGRARRGSASAALRGHPQEKTYSRSNRVKSKHLLGGKPMNLYITGGGTGGHVTPGLAIARYVMEHEPGSTVRFAGTERGIESRLVPREGYPLDRIEIIGLSRKLTPQGLAHNVKAAYLTVTAVARAKKLLRAAKPDVVLGCGGYVSYPIVKAAQQMKIPTVLLEVNALPGKVTQQLAPHADRVLVCFEQTRALLGERENIRLTGAPVRPEILEADRKKARARYGLSEGDKLVVSFWGSMGALYMNRHMAGMLALEAQEGTTFRHVHASGAAAAKWLPEEVQKKGVNLAEHPNIELTEYIYDMADRMAAADLVICRAGAATIGELCALGRPSVMVPSPFVAENHQEKNARALEEAGACKVVLEPGCTPEQLLQATKELIWDDERLAGMRRAAVKLAAADPDGAIFRQLKEVTKGRA
ncbi:undecaprenyldiphospho-muramoylpentapeptide beta-N-acetylglucosaminyltransferase [Clostridiaceae bacterium]|nr:undecaprenyldiphospho-muramoylpentapeptide beta-N-acetylglucosaminyltransferase [Clostridiaceae bacterium]